VKFFALTFSHSFIVTPTEKIKQHALALGFTSVGITRAEVFSDEARRLEAWLTKGFHGDMAYMENHFEKRINPNELFPDAKSIISVTANYFTPDASTADGGISMYAQGTDYHRVVKEKLQSLFDFVLQTVGAVNGRAFVDSAPLMDKAAAQRAGLGWIGKHSNLISPKHGSYFFIGNLLLDCELEYDAPFLTNHCGSCTACLDLCPTQAIVEPNVVDARKCISYLTIELKRTFTAEEETMLGEWLFGCDICQQVCPWNRFSTPTPLDDLKPKPASALITEDDILAMTKSKFAAAFEDTPLFRTGLRRLKRNAEAVTKNRLSKPRV
jgi:epoxyqueuosine reductase